MGSIHRSIQKYRGFIFGSVKREFQSKYRNSMLGAAWMVIQPLAMIIVYTVIFSQVMRAKLPGMDSMFSYSIYLCAGIINWGLFSEIVSRCQNVFIENANLLKKLRFPRICLPVIVVGTATLNYSIILSLFILFLVLSGNFPGLVFISIFPLLVVQVGFSVGLGVTLGVLNVFFRDVGQLFGVVLQFWFWFTPIVYPLAIIPESLRPLMLFNPMAGLVGAYQDVFVNRSWPDWQSLWFVALLSALLCFIGIKLFRKRVGEMVDEL